MKCSWRHQVCGSCGAWTQDLLSVQPVAHLESKLVKKKVFFHHVPLPNYLRTDTCLRTRYWGSLRNAIQFFYGLSIFLLWSTMGAMFVSRSRSTWLLSLLTFFPRLRRSPTCELRPVIPARSLLSFLWTCLFISFLHVRSSSVGSLCVRVISLISPVAW